jgi:hypothetical protein
MFSFPGGRAICSCSIAGVVGSNFAGVIDVCSVYCVLCR